MAVVTIATLPEDNGHTPREIDLHLTGDQALKLCRIRCGLQAEGAQLAGCERPIKDNAEAVRYLIEQATASKPLAEAVEFLLEQATASKPLVEAVAFLIEQATASKPLVESLEFLIEQATASE